MATEQIVLEDSSLDMNSMVESREVLWLVFTWTIKDFSKLKENVFYFSSKEILQQLWTFKMMKTKQTLFLAMESECGKKVANFRIVDKDNQNLNEGEVSALSEGQYVAEFSMKSVLDPKYGYINGDTLVAQCRFIEHTPDKYITVMPWDEYREREDMVNFQNDWREMYLKSIMCDFTIIVKKNRFPTHKVILAARSTFFAQMFSPESILKNDTQMEFDASPFIFHEVLMFMYTGELVQMNTTTLTEVMYIAKTLEIPTLLQKCNFLLVRDINENNVTDIYNRARDCSNMDLVKICTDYIQNNCAHLFQNIELDPRQEPEDPRQGPSTTKD